MKKANFENWVTLAFGTWLFFSPWIINYNLSDASAQMMSWNSWIVGFVVASLAALAIRDLRPWEVWVNLILGVWVVLSPWVFDYAHAEPLLWNSFIVGLGISVFSVIALPEAMKLEQNKAK